MYVYTYICVHMFNMYNMYVCIVVDVGYTYVYVYICVCMYVWVVFSEQPILTQELLLSLSDKYNKYKPLKCWSDALLHAGHCQVFQIVTE